MRLTAVAHLYRLVAALLLFACGGGDQQQGPPDTGNVRVAVSLTGTGSDPHGALLTLDGAHAQPVVGAPIVYEAVTAGDHSVELTGLHPRCVRAGPAVQSFTVATGATVEISYTADCRDIDQLAFVRYRSDVPGGRSIVIVDADGARQHDVFTPRDSVGSPAWSPDGRRLAFVYALAPDQPRGAVWTAYADGTDLLRVWADARFDVRGIAWSPDASRLAILGAQYQGGLTSIGTVFVVTVDGSSIVELPNTFGNLTLPSWAPDGLRFVFNVWFRFGGTFEGQPGGDFVVNRDGSSTQRLSSGVGEPQWSPVADMIATAQTTQISVVESDGTPVTMLPCASTCFDPRWSPDGSMVSTASHDGIVLLKVDGSGGDVLPGNASPQPVPWSASGRYVAWHNGSGITISRTDGSGTLELQPDMGFFSLPLWRP